MDGKSKQKDTDKIIMAFAVDPELRKQVKLKCARNGQQISAYLTNLIKNELEREREREEVVDDWLIQ